MTKITVYFYTNSDLVREWEKSIPSSAHELHQMTSYDKTWLIVRIRNRETGDWVFEKAWPRERVLEVEIDEGVDE